MRKLVLFAWLLFLTITTRAQETFPVNGVAEPKASCYAFTNATIVKDAATSISNASMIIRDGKITAIGTAISIPADAMVIDCKGKFIYPSFIDLYADYGMPVAQRTQGGFNFNAPAQLASNQKGAYGWNQAIRTDVQGVQIFTADNVKAKALRESGFGAALAHQRDGIARGTGVFVTLADTKENKTIIKEKAAAHYSFSKGTSMQSYPSSIMGSISLLRQTYLDAQWYKNNPLAEGVNLTLKYWNEQQNLPQIFEANDKWAVVRADKIGDEFGVQFIMKAGGNEYQRITDMAGTKATFILPLNYPAAMDIEDPHDARFVSLTDMKHWEMAPANAAMFEKAGINFVLTTSDLRDPRQFLTNLRKAMEYGLSESKAMEALTKVPATLLGVYDVVGSLDAGKLANFLITSGPIFSEKTTIYQNWVQGEKYSVKDELWNDVKGVYNLTVNTPGGAKTFTLDVKNSTTATVIGKDTLTGRFTFDGKQVRLNFPEAKGSRNNIRLSGIANDNLWSGVGDDVNGNRFTWTAVYSKETMVKADSTRSKAPVKIGSVTYPFNGYGYTEMPKQETILIKNATVWTNEKEGILQNTDVLIKNGKITAIGKNLSDAGAKVIDGSGKHVTAGIIDEHSHIAAASINEGGQSVTSEVRIADNLNPDDINIYRQLSGGVTSSHILHGSANTIGGQTQLIKLRWGANDEGLKFQNWPGYIKFALGENVKRTSSQQNNRFPDTRMGVSQVLIDAFTRARDYEAAWKKFDEEKKKNPKATAPRRDLELDALVEILNKKRFITCHSYVQSEITDMIRVADRFGFTLNTFTHILEGYKVADKMKAHGANASTFSDWWNYKMEVVDAIPYNANLMQKVGVNVAINSDDAEMARHLNHEAAKSVKYGSMSEEDALKMVTLNPSKMLRVDDRVGSIKVGKDADIVLWSDHPLSIYAKAEKTIVDGIVYYDREKDKQLRVDIAKERARLMAKMIGEKRSGMPTVPFAPSMEIMHTCSDHNHSHGLLVVDADELNQNSNQ
ncbi:imidazolonepropionase-like amidohydrolase [Lacibacter cauensis]|uniref:Imidazolonepropionase-like amidohydrolase n=1 Tax=Lacibacter cauensis TaxID=510947 RepID=A0A562SRE3_9BACT|nr:amidohydrolase family protein [Lacibacter cauensis]TWI83350.1 imidazolonepropionase-like amidohydrolase [Lacibacter cauensis]